jgi:hypothetical protein
MTNGELIPPWGHLHIFGRLVWDLLTHHIDLLVGLAAIIITYRYAKSPWRCVPPGPRGLPLLGNVIKVREGTILFGADWKKKFGVFIAVGPQSHDIYRIHIPGDIVYLNVLGQPIVVINSLEAAAEILDRRANIYSDRPRLIVANEILCGGLLYAFIPYGDL